MLAYPALKTIDASRPQNTPNTSSRKVCEKDGANKPVHDEGDDAIASHQRYMFLVQSHLVQEQEQTKIIDNVSMAAPAKVIQNTMVSTASPIQVTTHTQNSTDTDTKNN